MALSTDTPSELRPWQAVFDWAPPRSADAENGNQLLICSSARLIRADLISDMIVHQTIPLPIFVQDPVNEFWGRCPVPSVPSARVR
jgi:hypothetical protein